MTYEHAKLVQSVCESEERAAAAVLKKWDADKRPDGSTPDFIKALTAWKVAKNNYDVAFASLRKINQYVNKHFKKEERAARRK